MPGLDIDGSGRLPDLTPHRLQRVSEGCAGNGIDAPMRNESIRSKVTGVTFAVPPRARVESSSVPRASGPPEMRRHCGCNASACETDHMYAWLAEQLRGPAAAHTHHDEGRHSHGETSDPVDLRFHSAHAAPARRDEHRRDQGEDRSHVCRRPPTRHPDCALSPAARIRRCRSRHCRSSGASQIRGRRFQRRALRARCSSSRVAPLRGSTPRMSRILLSR